jgi:tRNA (guanine-N7-)-methyltransferase
LTPARAELFERLAPRFTLEERGPVLELADVFGREHAVVLDIGFGIADCLLAMAVAEPDVDVIGVEVHTPGIAGALAGIEQFDLTNVRLVHGDAVPFLDRLPTESLTAIRIFFPDPWPKARHQHRRLVSAAIVDRLVGRLRPGGSLHLATDSDDYAEQMQRVCDVHSQLRGGPVTRPPERPVTRYEQKGIEAGHQVVDFRYWRVH